MMNAFGARVHSDRDCVEELHDEARALQIHERNFASSWNRKDIVWLGAFAGTQVASLIVLALLPMGYELNSIVNQLQFSFMLAESAFAGMWLSLGSGPFIRRLLLTPLWLVLSASFIGFIGRPPYAVMTLLIMGGSFALSITLFGLFLRRLLRLNLVHGTTSCDSNAFQFGIKDWFMVTLCISASLAFELYAKVERLGSAFDVMMAALNGVAWAFAVLPALYLSLRQTNASRFFLGIIGSGLMTAVIAAGLGFLATQMVQKYSGFDPLFPLFVKVVPLYTWVIITCGLLLLRGARYRLVRLTK
jgi:hypothetical protein